MIGFGKAELINDMEEKKNGLNIIMKHYSQKNNYKYNEKMLKRILIIKVEIEEITGKKSGY